MLIRFKVVAGPSIEMYEKEALKMIRLMGHSGTVPSALSAEDVLPAIQKLESKLNRQIVTEPKMKDELIQAVYDHDFVDVKTRAFPLLELLKRAHKDHKSIMWDTV